MESKGEVAALADTINSMTDTLATFADQVTSVAREVGVEGRLGGQANVPGAAGTWQDLTANVNLLAANLTTQVRAIAEVATAVTKGDLTRSIQVEARGEVSELKDNINAMIGNLRDTTERNTEQDWLKTNLAKFSRMMQGQRDLVTVGQMLLAELAPLVNAQQGVIYIVEPDERRPVPQAARDLRRCGRGGYAAPLRDARRAGRPVRRGRPAHAAATTSREDVIHVRSGLLAARARNVIALPVLYEGQVKAVIELASLHEFTASHLAFLEQLTGTIGVVLNTIEATMRTEACSSSRRSSPANCRRSRTSCSRPTRSSPPRRGCSPSRTPKWSARTRKSSWRAARSKRRRPSSRSPRATSPSSSPTCRTSCARRSTAS